MLLYPEITPFHEGFLETSDNHNVYYQQYGNPEGLPIVLCHGGPGAGLSEKNAQLFNPEKFHLILFDQRGCGRSTPRGDITQNTPTHLIQDMEDLRQHLKLDQWWVMGSSWGSTLSLLYAQSHPEKCLGLIVRGVFLGTKEEIEWPQEVVPYFYPDLWEQFLKTYPEKTFSWAGLSKFLYDEEHQLNVAEAFCGYEYKTAHFMPLEELEPAPPEVQEMLLNLARLMVHYFKNKTFLEENQILKNMHKIDHLPGHILHGRYDMICPTKYAYSLHKAWPGSKFHMIPDAGHSGSIPAVQERVLSILEAL